MLPIRLTCRARWRRLRALVGASSLVAARSISWKATQCRNGSLSSNFPPPMRPDERAGEGCDGDRRARGKFFGRGGAPAQDHPYRLTKPDIAAAIAKRPVSAELIT